MGLGVPRNDNHGAATQSVDSASDGRGFAFASPLITPQPWIGWFCNAIFGCISAFFMAKLPLFIELIWDSETNTETQP